MRNHVNMLSMLNPEVKVDYGRTFVLMIPPLQMNNYIVRSYRDVIVITTFAITKFATRRASKAQSILMH